MLEAWIRRGGAVSSNVVCPWAVRVLGLAIFLVNYLFPPAQAQTFAQLVETSGTQQSSPGMPRWGPLARHRPKANFVPVTSEKMVVPAAMPDREHRSFVSQGLLPEEQILLSLMEQEHILLQDYGPDYFQVRNVRARIKAAEEFIARRNAQRSSNPPPAPIIANSLGNIVPGNKAQVGLADAVAPTSKERTGGAAARVFQTAREHEEEEPEAVPVAPSKATKRHQAAAREVNTEDIQIVPAIGFSLWPLTLLLLFAVLAGLVLGLLIHFFVVLWAIRHFGSKPNPWPRAEGVVSSAEAAPTLTKRPTDLQSAPEPGLAAATIPGNGSGNANQHFEPPPAQEEVLNQKKNETEQREDAMLRQVYEQNVHLRKQIGQLKTVTV